MGTDAHNWYEKSILVEQSIERVGLIHTISNLTQITSTVHCGWPFLLGLYLIYLEKMFSL